MIDLVSAVHAATTTATTVAKATHSSGGSILDPIAKPLASILAGIYSVIPNYGVAIIGLSVLWMIIISPLTLKSTRSMLAMQKLQPELKKLQEKHRNDKQAFAQAQMDLFREHNTSPFGSCLPLLLPLPVFFALFRVIDGLSHTIKVNGVVTAAPKYLSTNTSMYHAIVAAHGHIEAFGMDLSKGALSPHSGILSAAPYWITLLLMGFSSYLQTAMMQNRNQAAAAANPQMRMMKYLAPLLTIVFIRFPAGVILYYLTSNVCRIIQQDAMYRFDPKVKTLVAREVEEVEELTHEIDERDRNRPGYTPPRGARSSPPERSGPQPGAGRGAGGSTGRSRFRDLLAAAAEQQRAQQETKATGNGGAKPDGSNRNGQSSAKEPSGGEASGNGRAAGNARGGSPGGGSAGGSSGGAAGRGADRAGGAAGPGGSRGGGRSGRNRPAGSRTNRKRRGR